MLRDVVGARVDVEEAVAPIDAPADERIVGDVAVVERERDLPTLVDSPAARQRDARLDVGDREVEEVGVADRPSERFDVAGVVAAVGVDVRRRACIGGEGLDRAVAPAHAEPADGRRAARHRPGQRRGERLAGIDGHDHGNVDRLARHADGRAVGGDAEGAGVAGIVDAVHRTVGRGEQGVGGDPVVERGEHHAGRRGVAKALVELPPRQKAGDKAVLRQVVAHRPANQHAAGGVDGRAQALEVQARRDRRPARGQRCAGGAAVADRKAVSVEPHDVYRAFGIGVRDGVAVGRRRDGRGERAGVGSHDDRAGRAEGGVETAAGGDALQQQAAGRRHEHEQPARRVDRHAVEPVVAADLGEGGSGEARAGVAVGVEAADQRLRPANRHVHAAVGGDEDLAFVIERAAGGADTFCAKGDVECAIRLEAAQRHRRIAAGRQRPGEQVGAAFAVDLRVDEQAPRLRVRGPAVGAEGQVGRAVAAEANHGDVVVDVSTGEGNPAVGSDRAAAVLEP